MRRRAAPAACVLMVLVLLAGCGGDGGPVEPLEGTAPRGDLPLGTAVTVVPLRRDDVYRRILAGTFTSVTPENEQKWEVVQPARGRFAFDAADAVVDTARTAGKRVRGHPLVWDQQLPEWVTDAPAGELEAILRDHVRRVARHFRGRVAQWDVVNEPLENSGALTPNVFQRAMGEGYIDVAFEEARRADPEAKLFLNEIAAERGRKADALVRLVAALKGRGVPIDGVGLQNHTTSDDFPTRRDLSRLMARIARLGLDVEITEMDVEGPDERGRTAAYAAAGEACARAANCTGLTVWGVSDTTSWLGAAKQPTLFDAGGRAKPALGALRDALRR